MSQAAFQNPFRPGAGHKPPYLAGRDGPIEEFRKLLGQTIILENVVITGLRGVGKTVLLDSLRPIAIELGWSWVGADLSESASISEERLVQRILADLSVATSTIELGESEAGEMGFHADNRGESIRIDFDVLTNVYQNTPGLVYDKLKAVLKFVWSHLRKTSSNGIVFAYDEAQNLTDHASKNEYPLSLMLDTFQSIQKEDIPFMLILAGLPTLQTKLVEARTFSERMFHTIILGSLNEEESREAIVKPFEQSGCPRELRLDDRSISLAIENSGGYPYFIQFICREIYDVFLQKHGESQPFLHPFMASLESIIRKLDADFFAGRWGRATDRQRDLMTIAAHLDDGNREFTVQEIVEKSKVLLETGVLEKSFNSSHVNQMLSTLQTAGLIYKNRHGRYSFAVPLMARFIMRQIA